MEYNNKWLCSYETLLFDTPDGDIDIGQYAPDGNGTGYYIRTKPKTEAQFEWADLTFKTAGLKKVAIVPGGHAYYDEFLTALGATNLWTADSIYSKYDPSQLPSGSVLRVQSTATKYWDTAQIKAYPQPSKTEIVAILPPPEPLPERLEPKSIALDATSNSGLKSSVSSYSWSHTCTGTNLLLAFGDSHRAASDRTVTGVTYDDTALTSIRSDMNNPYHYVRTSIFYLIAPATGALTVAVTLSGTTDQALGGVVSYTGTKQSGQPDANNGANDLSTTPSVNVTTVADNSWVFDAVVHNATGGTFTCGNTQRWLTQGLYDRFGGADTNGPKTPPGSQTMSWVHGQTSAGWAISAASFAPAAEGATVADSLQPIWNVRMFQADTVRPIWNIKAQTIKAGQYIWNVLTGVPIADAIGLVWNVKRQLADSVKPVWNVRIRLADTIQSIWNVKNTVSDAIRAIFNVRKGVAQAVIAKWNVRTFLSDTAKAIWNVRLILADSVKPVWNVKAIVSDSINAVWNVRYSLTDTTRYIWNVGLELAKTIRPIWNIRASLADSMRAVWNVKTVLGRVGQYLWNVRRSVADSVALKWNVRAFLSDSVNAIWNVLSGFKVADTVKLVWNVRFALAQNVKPVWNVRLILSDSVKVIWNAKAVLTDSVKAIWNVLSGFRISDAVNLVWDVRQLLASTSRSIWNVLAPPVTPPVTPPITPPTLRAPSVRIALMVYKDVLQGWMEPWRYSAVESKQGQELMAAMPRIQMETIERQRMSELAQSYMSLCRATTFDIFKGKELFTASATFETETPDKLRFGLIRKILISQDDKFLGIE